MKIEFELWHLISLLITFLGASAGVGKLLLGQSQRHLDQRFSVQDKTRDENHAATTNRLSAIENAARADANNWQRIEREVLMLKADLPQRFVMREDYIRGQSLIEAKLDALAGKLENAALRVAQVSGEKRGY